MVIQFSRSRNPHTYLVETNMQHKLRRSGQPNFKRPWSTEHESTNHPSISTWSELFFGHFQLCSQEAARPWLKLHVWRFQRNSSHPYPPWGRWPWDISRHLGISNVWIAGDSGNGMNFMDRNWKSKFSSDVHPTNTISVLPKHCNSRSWRFIKGTKRVMVFPTVKRVWAGPFKYSLMMYEALSTTPSTWHLRPEPSWLMETSGFRAENRDLMIIESSSSTTPEAHAMPRIQDQA